MFHGVFAFDIEASRPQLFATPSRFVLACDIAAKGKDAAAVGDEGGFAPNIQDNDEGLVALMEAIKDSGHSGKANSGRVLRGRAVRHRCLSCPHLARSGARRRRICSWFILRPSGIDPWSRALVWPPRHCIPHQRCGHIAIAGKAALAAAGAATTIDRSLELVWHCLGHGLGIWVWWGHDILRAGLVRLVRPAVPLGDCNPCAPVGRCLAAASSAGLYSHPVAAASAWVRARGAAVAGYAQSTGALAQ